jgi:hypothetical protein
MSPSQSVLSKHIMKKWEPWETNLRKSNNTRMLQQLALHTQKIMKTTSTQDLDPRPLTNHDHPSVLPFEMFTLDPGDPPSRSLNWNPGHKRGHSTHETGHPNGWYKYRNDHPVYLPETFCNHKPQVASPQSLGFEHPLTWRKTSVRD